MARIIPEADSSAVSGTVTVSSGTVTIGTITEPTDASGNLEVSLATKIAGEDITNDRMKVEHSYSGIYISTATTTTVKSGTGFLHAINLGETAAGAITIYDNTAGSGTIIGVLKASVAEQTFFFDVNFSTGLTIVTAAASKITVVYR